MADESTNKPNARRTERIGKYEVVGHIATGGMGVIYKALDVDLDRLVALKILPPDLAKQQVTLVRFYREARAAAKLRHENIVTLFDVGESNGTHYIALEYIEGTDLQDYINRKCRLDPDEARQIIIQAARALAHAHEQGIVHRDVKPSNFLLTHKGDRLIVKLTDFGLAIRQENDAEFRITKDKTTVGTVDYMSPEQARDSRSADIRSDIYSLGCTFYHMLAGEAPFAKGTMPERLIRHMKSAPPLRKLNKLVPEYLVTIINRMLAKKPEDRYQTPAELLHDLENPDQVPVSGKRGAATGKLERGRKQPRDLTQVIENQDLDVEDESPRQVRTRVQKKARPRVEDPVDDIEDEEPRRSLDRDEPWEPDPDEAAPEDDEELPRKKSGPGAPIWIWALLGAGGVLVLVIMIAFMIGGRGGQTNRPNEKPPAPPEPIAIKDPEPKIEKPDPVVTIDTSPSKMTVPLRGLPTMSVALQKADPVELRREFSGPFSVFPEPAKGSTVLLMRRLAPDRADAFRSLADALDQAKPEKSTIIEIYDDGPIYVPLLTVAPDRHIVLRGAGGYRPLIVWEVPKKSAGVFLTMSKGRLTLDNLDIVVVWSDNAPAALFDLSGTDFYARDCTFSVAGESPKGEGVTLVRRSGAAPDDRPAQTWFQRCYVRGADLSLLRLHESSATVLVEDSLVVGYQHPLIDVRGRDQDVCQLHCIRSSLITGQVLLRCRPSDKDGSPKVAVQVLDSILSRDDATSRQGDMIQIAEGADPAKVSWKAANSVYAGWKQLLAAAKKKIAGTDRDAWRQQWRYIDSEFDQAVLDTWPDDPPSGLAEQSADLFRPKYLPLATKFVPVAFSALTGDGSIGCVIGRLPPAPEEWMNRTFKQGAVPLVAGGDPMPPAIEKVGDFYNGERIDLTKVPDVGKYLTDKLQKVVPAPRVVIHLAGKGTFQTSPLRVKGVQSLVIFFEPNFKDPITLEENSNANLAKTPLIDVSGGRLELIGARIRLGTSTFVPAIVHVEEGNLTLTRCWLLGPHTRSPGFQNLVTVSSAGPEPATLLMRDSVLLAGRLLIKLQNQAQLHARSSVFLSLGDGVLFDAQQPTVQLKHVLDHNSWAVRQSFFMLKTGPEFQPAEPITLYAGSNAFLQPFADDSDKGALLRGGEGWVASGRWSWRGRFNVYDPRMNRYFTGSDRIDATRQSRSDWQAAWGQMNEQEPLLLPIAAGKLIATESATQASLLSQLDRLILPPELRGEPGQFPPGADLVFLGIKKK
jgi:serine/threonine-protein kinase